MWTPQMLFLQHMYFHLISIHSLEIIYFSLHSSQFLSLYINYYVDKILPPAHFQLPVEPPLA